MSDLEYNYVEGPFAARKSVLSLLFRLALLCALSAQAVESDLPLKVEPAEKSKAWYCELPLMQGLSLRIKALRDRVAWGRVGTREIQEGDYQSYLRLIEESHDNRSIEIPSPYGPLLGFDADRSARIQQVSADNENGITPTYYKDRESAEWKTLQTLERIWFRARNGAISPEWTAAMENIRVWLRDYQNYGVTLNQLILEGFEAKKQATVLRAVLDQKSPKDFQSAAVIRDGVKVKIPLMTWDLENKRVVESEREVSFRSYPELKSSYLDAAHKFAKIFGLPTDPLTSIKERRFNLRRIAPLNYINPLFYFFMIPVRIVSDIFGTSMDTYTWLKSKIIATGHLQEVIDIQAYRRKRLELAHKVISNRRDYLGYELNETEQQLLSELERDLLDPKLAPRSDAVRREQAMQLRAENWEFYGSKTGINTETPGTPEAATSPIVPGTPASAPAPSTNAKSDRGSQLLRDYKVENHEQLSYWRTFKTYYHRYKKVAAVGLFTTSLTGIIWLQLDNVVAPIRDNPHLNYAMAAGADHLNLMVMQYFNTYDSGNAIIRKQAKSAYKVWDLENPTVWEIVHHHLSRFRERYRVEGDKYNFLADPEFQKEQARVFDKLLDVRREFGVSALFDSGLEYLTKVGYPKQAAKQALESLRFIYPDHEQILDQIMEQIEAGTWSGDMRVNVEFVKISNPKLYADLKYFFEVKFPEATDRIRKSGLLMSKKGDAYYSWVKAPPEYVNKVAPQPTNPAVTLERSEQK